jgi:hypothetical protein
VSASHTTFVTRRVHSASSYYYFSEEAAVCTQDDASPRDDAGSNRGYVYGTDRRRMGLDFGLGLGLGVR